MSVLATSFSTPGPGILAAPSTEVEAQGELVAEVTEKDAEAEQNEREGEGKRRVAAVEQEVRNYFADIPVMIDIAWCESKFTHHGSDGSVLRGIVTSDVGVMQVNEYYHGETAEALELDLHDLRDNMAYARNLYEREGTRPWNASSHCWKSGRHLAQQ